MTETTTTTDITNPAEVDARINREREIATKARAERAASAKAKKAAQPKPASKPVAKKEGSMAEFVDNLLLTGITWTDLETRAAAEAKKRGSKFGATLGSLKSHVKYRSGQSQWKVVDAKGSVKMVKIEKPKPSQPKAKVAPAKKPVKLMLTSSAKMGAARKTTKENQQTVE